MNEYSFPILYGVLVGVLSRLYMLRTDYRQYPTYLHGKIIHIALGFIAASLGTIAVPAIMEKEFTAVTFLTLAASQFREVRNMERNTLTEIDKSELVPRGKTYIEGIAIAFESRNYLVIFTSFFTTFSYLLTNVWVATIVGLVCLILSKILMTGSKMGDIVSVEEGKPQFKDAGLYVDDIYIMNIGIPEKRDLVLKYGMGFILNPKSIDARITISNLGQRQAVLHDVSTALGVVRDSGEPSLTPLAKRDLENGRIGVFVLPQHQDVESAIKVIKKVPILENAIRLPTESAANEKESE
ncbi:YIEGIA family protein [Bacillus carboniphilus]|uniref:YIEGIA family protein n=1 Tax=Bacillus carboniphilus TaxID=86663 RepID=A0ABY9JWJ4_9BACI|nr:YIEGIA family protein [Bacillus carboniphilus]WLR43749.1 YIEGIA family protein [Bacillus carboniphilus]